jgi:hypothetical protein
MERDWEALLKDKDALLKATGLAYMGLGLYFGLKQTPKRKRREPVQEVRPQPVKPLSLGEAIAKMIEETYGVKREYK